VALGNTNNATGQGAVALGNASSATAASALAFGDTATANQTNAIALGANATAGTQAGDVALGANSATSTVVNTTSATVNNVTYSGFAGTNALSTVSVGAPGSPRTVTNVAAGQINAGSTDAINGSQLYSVANTLESNVTAAQTHDYSVNSTSSGTDTNYNNGGASGANALAAGVSASAAGISATAVGNNANASSANSVALGNGSKASIGSGVAIGNGATAGTNAGDVALGSGSTTAAVVNTPNASINGTTYTFAGTNATSTVSVGGATPRTITNVAAGQISGSSTDAVNGSQLFAANSAITTVGGQVTNLGNSVANSLGGGSTYNSTTGAVTTSLNYGGNTYNSVQNVLNQIGGAVDGGGIKYFHANSTLADSQATGTDSVAIGPVSTAGATNAVSIGNGATASANTGDIALGAGSVTAAVVQTPSTVIAGTTYNFAGGAPTSTVSVGSGTNQRTITNVAAGQISGSSTDAINGSQLYATNQAVNTLNNSLTTVTGELTHYYSVNDGGTHQGNYNNNGATGTDSLASGVNASATATNATAIGFGSQALAASTVAIGDSNTVAAGSGTGSIAGGYQSRVLGGTGAVALGNQQTVNGDGAVAIGDPNSVIGTGAVGVGANNTVNGQGAVALGNGNTATGQGAVALGNASSATAASALAFGDTATANQTNAIALGAGATAGTNAGDVALGSGSVTAAVVQTPSTVIAGTTYNFAGGAPTSTVSVGSGTNQRTITNVAAGQINGNSTDAINGSQLYATNQAIDTLNTTVNNGLTHYYGVNDGGTQQANYNNNGATAANAMAAGVAASATAANATAVGYNTQATIADSVALGSGSVTDHQAPTVPIGSIAPYVQYNVSDRTLLGQVSVGNATGYRQITNVADGTASDDAVTVRQLAGAIGAVSVTSTKYFHANSTAPDSLAVGNNAIAVGPNTITNGDEGVAMGDGAIVQQSAPGGVAIGETAVTNSADAVAMGTKSNANGIGAVAIGTLSTAGKTATVALGSGSNASAQAGDVALGANSSTATVVNTPNTVINGTTYTFAGTNATSTVSVGAVGTPRTVTNVAAGQINGNSTDAINGSQLYATNQAVTAIGTTTTNLGNTVASALGGSTTYDPITGAVTTNLSYGGNTYNSVQSVLNQIGGAVDGAGIKYFHANSSLADSNPVGTNSVAIGPVSTASTTNAVSIGNGATAGANAGDVALGAGSTTSAVQGTSNVTVGGNTYAVAGTNPTSTVSVGSAGNERTITNVAAGQVTSTSTDAINGSELYATNQQVNANTSAIANLNTTVSNINNGGSKYFSANSAGTAASATGTNSVAEGPSSTASGTDSTAIGDGSSSSGNNSVALGAGSTDGGRSNVVSVGSSTDQRQITNVAAGTASTDAVNVAQLQQSQAGSVQYDKNSDGTVNYSSVTVGQAGTPAQVHNVAAGTATTDAANVGQVNQGVQTAENWAQNYTDQKLAGINHQLNSISNRANAGVAAGIAMSSLGQAYQPNLSSFGVGFGSFHGEAGVAVGLSTITESGRYIFKLAASSDSRGDVGVGGSVNVVW